MILNDEQYKLEASLLVSYFFTPVTSGEGSAGRTGAPEIYR